jgi:hypothetical protein
MSNQQYTTQLQAGLGMISENLHFLDAWEPEDDVQTLYHRLLETGEGSNVTARRLRNLVAEMFAPRFLADDNRPATHLKILKDRLDVSVIGQFIYLYTVRAQRIFYDFMATVYWRIYESGRTRMDREEIIQFIEESLDEGRMQKRWSESTIRRVTGYLGGCAVDFGFFDKARKGSYEFISKTIPRSLSLYLAYELHFLNYSDEAVTHHDDWKLWGMSPHDAQRELEALGRGGHLIFQGGGSVVRVSWRYQTMEEVLDVIN